MRADGGGAGQERSDGRCSVIVEKAEDVGLWRFAVGDHEALVVVGLVRTGRDRGPCGTGREAMPVVAAAKPPSTNCKTGLAPMTLTPFAVRVR